MSVGEQGAGDGAAFGISRSLSLRPAGRRRDGALGVTP